MKKLLLITLTALIHNVFAQNNYAFVANGGKFESGEVDQYIDRATLGVIDLETNVYTVLDTVDTESVQDIEIGDVDGGYVYLAAEDSIIVYRFDPVSVTASRIAEVPFLSDGAGSIGQIAVASDYLIAGRSWGSGDDLIVYDRFDLSEVFVSSKINSSVDDILVLNDSSVVIASADTVYMLNLNSLEISYDYPLYDNGSVDLVKGLDENTFLAVISGYDANWNTVSKSIKCFNYDFENTGSLFESTDLGITSFVSDDSYGSILGKSTDGNVYDLTYSVTEKTFTLADVFTTYGSKTVARTTINTAFISTDFDTYGDVILNNGNDTISVGVSPEGIVFGEFLVAGIFDNVFEDKISSAYFANQLQNTDFENCVLYNTNGVVIGEYLLSSDINAFELVSGNYMLSYTNNVGSQEIVRVLKYN